MAYVIKYRTSRYWIAAFRDSNGKQYRRSTRETNRARAQCVALIYERAAKAKGSPQRVRKVISGLLAEHFEEGLPSTTVREFFNQWLDARRGETSPATYRRYRDAAERFLEFLGSKAETDLDEIQKKQITEYRDAQCARVSTSTANSYLKLVRMMFRSARQDGVLLQDPSEGVRPAKERHRERARKPFTIDEIRSILSVANDEWKSIIRCALFTGQRLSDLVALTWNQIDFEHNEIRLTTRKTGRRLIIPLADQLREHLLGMAGNDNPSGPLHPRAYATVHSQQGRTNTLSLEFAEILVNAGLREYKDHQGRGIGRDARRAQSALTFHSLRHTSVSMMKAAGISDSTVMALIGHETVRMSDHYSHASKGELAQAVRALPEI